MSLGDPRPRSPRGTRPDAERPGEFLVVKNVGVLGATYQMRLLIFLASQRGYHVVLRVPHHFTPAPSLSALLEQHPGVVRIEKAQ